MPIPCALLQDHTWDEHTQVYFKNGYVRAESPPLLLRNVPARLEVYTNVKGSQPTRREIFPDNGRLWAYKAEMQHFVDCVRDGTPFRSPAADAAKDIAAIEAIYRKAFKL